jgi:hypothetical protein
MIEGGLHTSSLGRTNIPFAAGHKKSISSSAIITPTQMTDSHTLPRVGSGGRIESTYSGPGPKIGIRRNSSLSILTSRMALVPPAQRELQAQMQVPAQMMQMDVTQGSQAQQTAHAEAPAGPMAPLAPSLQLILGDFMESLNIAQAEERAVAAEYVQQAQQQVNQAQAQVEAQMAVQRVRSNAMMAAAVAQQQQQQNQQRQDGVQYSADMFVDDQSVSQNNYIGQTAATTQSPMFYAQLPDGSFVPVLDNSRILQQQPIAIQQPQFDAAAMYNSLQQKAAPGEKIIMVPYRTDETGNMYPIQCSIQTMSPGSARGILSSQGMMMQNFASPISTPTLSSMGTAGSLKLSDNIAMTVENDPYATAPGSYSWVFFGFYTSFRDSNRGRLLAALLTTTPLLDTSLPRLSSSPTASLPISPARCRRARRCFWFRRWLLRKGRRFSRKRSNCTSRPATRRSFTASVSDILAEPNRTDHF